MDAKSRRQSVALLGLICLAVALKPLINAGNDYWTLEPDFHFYGTDDGGPVDWNTTVLVDTWYWNNSLICFTNFRFQAGSKTWGRIGFSCSGNADMQIREAESAQLKYTVNASKDASSMTKLYLYGNDGNFTIEGVNNWSYDKSKQILTAQVLHESPATVTLTFSGNPPPAPPSFADSLLSQYFPLGDISGFIIASYTDVMGMLFFALILLPPILGTYMKGGVMPAIIVMLLCWGIIYMMIPALAINLIVIFLALAVGLLLARLFLSRRT